MERAYSHYMHFYIKMHDIRDVNSSFTADSEFVMTSLYYKQLQQYLQFFEKKNILILSYDDISNDISAVLIKIYNFIGIETRFISEKVFNKYNVTKEKPLYPSYFLKIRQYFPFYKFLSSKLHHNLKKYAMSYIERKNPYNFNDFLNKLNKENYNQIVTVFKDDILKFAKHIDNDISCLIRFLHEFRK